MQSQPVADVSLSLSQHDLHKFCCKFQPPLAKHMLENLVGAFKSERRRGMGGARVIGSERSTMTRIKWISIAASKRVKGPSKTVLKAKHHNVDEEISEEDTET